VALPDLAQEEAAYQQALLYIEENRKSNVSITVVDQGSVPVSGAEVSYRQETHDFAFGFIGNPQWATPADMLVPLDWTPFEFEQGLPVPARLGMAEVVSKSGRCSEHCLHVTIAPDQHLGIASREVEIDPGATYQLTLWIKIDQVPSSGIDFNAAIYWGKDGEEGYGGVMGFPLRRGDYIRLSSQATAPSTITEPLASVAFDINPRGAGCVEFSLDDICLARSGTTKNLLHNPSFEEDEAEAWELWTELCQDTSPMIALEWGIWREIEPQPDVFHWELADYWFGRILARHPDAQFLLWFWFGDRSVPDWVNFDRLSEPEVFEKFKQDVYDYVYHVAQRYSDKVRWWGTHNESNTEVVLGWFNTIDNAVEVNRTIIEAIRDVEAGSKIMLTTSAVFADGTIPGVSPLEYARTALEAGLRVDGISLEAYPWPLANPLFYRDYARQLASLGKPVFIQETGYPSRSSPTSWCFQAWGERYDEPAQAAWVKYMTAIPFGTSELIGVFYVFAVDSQCADWEYKDMGLFTRDARTKQAYDVYRQHIQMFTTSGSATTDDKGEIAFRGFAGEYTITVTAPDGCSLEETFHIGQESDNSFIITLD
jgi:hypothetical protein